MSQATQKLSWSAGSPTVDSKIVKYGGLIVTGWLLVLFVLVNALVPRLRVVWLQMYLLEPALWLSLAGLAWWLWRQESGNKALPRDRQLLLTAAIIGAFQIAVFSIAGIFFGFGASPYARKIYWLILNLWFVGSRLVGLEMARWYLVQKLGKRSMFGGVFIAWALLLLVTIPTAAYGQFGDVKSAFRYSGRVILPAASEGLLATYLVLAGGPWASIAYRGILLAFEWLSPILPNLKWLVTAFIGTIVPAIGVMLVHNYFIAASEGEESSSEGAEKSGSMTGWTLIAVLGLLLYWFNTGLFGVQPTLVSGFSMKPTFVAGDVVITREVPAESIEADDIIRFKQHDVYVLHRVLEVRDDGQGRILFFTQGDNNRDPDPLVEPAQLAGKVILIVPKIGWVSIGVRRAFEAIGGILG